MRYTTKKILFSLCIVFLVLSFMAVAHAQSSAEVYFRTTAESFTPGEEFTVGVFINSDTPVNAYNLEIAFNPELVRLASFNTNNSLVDFWRGEPEVHREGIIRMEGGSLESFQGRAGEVIKLNLVALREGSAQISFRSASVFAADGMGTPVQLERGAVDILISQEGADVGSEEDEVDENGDAEPPTIREARFVDNTVDGSTLVVFDVHDSGSGVDGVFLRTMKWGWWSDWSRATNPTPVDENVWAFQVRAVDNAGNESFESVYAPERSVPHLPLALLFVLLLLSFGYVKIK